jgi:hypothetical protein
MGEIIVLMGKMADKMSKLMLATEPPDEDDDDETLKIDGGPMTPDEAETKAEQILSLLAAGDDTYELEWKKQEIKSILTSETMHPRKRTNDKQRALEELALGDGEDRSHRSSSDRRSSRTKRRSKSLGVATDGRDMKSVTSSSRPTERAKSSRSNSLGIVDAENALASAAPKLSKRQSSRSLGKDKGKSERNSSRGTSRSTSRSGLTKKRSSRSIGAEKKKNEDIPASPTPEPVDGTWQPLNTPEGNEDFRLVSAIT